MLKKVKAAIGNKRGRARPKVKVTNTVVRIVAYLKWI
jgi:hypothetical protein